VRDGDAFRSVVFAGGECRRVDEELHGIRPEANVHVDTNDGKRACDDGATQSKSSCGLSTTATRWTRI